MADAKTNGYAPRLKERYRSELVGALKDQLTLGNVMEVPRPVKAIVNMGVGDASRDAKLIDGAIKDLTVITGQKPAVRKARKSIATFKIRQGMPIGASTTIRGDRMWDFLDRLVSIVLPRIRDFRGLNPWSFDGNGNYSLGLTEQLVFPELNPDKYLRAQGMNIAICCSAGSDDESREMLKLFGLPFKNPDEAAA